MIRQVRVELPHFEVWLLRRLNSTFRTRKSYELTLTGCRVQVGFRLGTASKSYESTRKSYDISGKPHREHKGTVKNLTKKKLRLRTKVGAASDCYTFTKRARSVSRAKDSKTKSEDFVDCLIKGLGDKVKELRLADKLTRVYGFEAGERWKKLIGNSNNPETPDCKCEASIG